MPYVNNIYVSREHWFEMHREYLKSDQWKYLRFLVFKRAKLKCEVKWNEKCEKVASQVDHISYKNWRNESLDELQAVCDYCHKVLTAYRRRMR